MVFASVGISFRTCAMQSLKFGGSFGTITGWPGLWAAWPLAATYIQWLNVWVVIGLPATLATASPGTPLPQPGDPTATTKKAPSARIELRTFIERGDGSEPSRESMRSREECG